MKRVLVIPFLLALFAADVVAGQILSVSVQRQEWTSQAATNPAPLNYTFDATMTGVGLQKATIIAPSGARAEMAGSTVQMSYTTNYPVVSFTGTNLSAGLTNLNANYPAGVYQLVGVTATTNPITKAVTYATNQLSVAVTNDFPLVNPLITNVLPFMALAATQSFRWPVFASGADGSYVAFSLLEGRFDTNLLKTLATNSLSLLTNLTLLTSQTKLPPSANSLTATNLDPALDHLAALEFHALSAQSSQPVLLAGKSTTLNLAVFLHSATTASTNTITLAISQTNGQVAVTWATNTASTYTLQTTTNIAPQTGGFRRVGPMSFHPLWQRLTNQPALNHEGRLEVRLPAELPQRFFRLEAP